MKFDPNNPEYWTDYDPTQEGITTEFVDGKSEASVKRGRANRVRAKDAEWLEKTRAKNAELPNDPEWRDALIRGIHNNIESYRTAAQLREEDPEYREKRDNARDAVMATEEYKRARAEGIKRNSKDPEWLAKVTIANQDSDRRAKHSASVTGEKHSQFKGWLVGTCKKTGKQIRYAGAAALEAAGFIYAHVNCCVNGKPGFKSHKGYTWRREE